MRMLQRPAKLSKSVQLQPEPMFQEKQLPCGSSEYQFAKALDQTRANIDLQMANIGHDWLIQLKHPETTNAPLDLGPANQKGSS